MTDNESVTKSAGTVSGAIFTSRVLGFVRDIVIASFWGATLFADAFFVAFRISNLLRRLLAEGALTAAFVPVFTEYLHLKKREEAWRLVNLLLSILTIILIVIAILGIIFSPFIVRVIAPGFYASSDKFDLTVLLTRIMFPYIIFISLAALAMGILNSLNHFLVPAISPALWNISIISFALLLSPRLEKPVVGLAIGAVVGGIAQLLIQVPILLKKGMRFRFIIDMNDPGVKRIWALMLPAVFGMSITEINLLVDNILASLLPGGSVSYLYYGNRLVQFPLGIFGVAMGIAVLPMMSGQVARNEIHKLKDTFSFAIRLVFFITVPATIGLILLRFPIINTLFERGEFVHITTIGVAQAVFYYSVGLCAFAGLKVVVPAFYSMHDTKTPVKIGAYATLANIILNIILMGPLKHGGLALATSLSSLMNVSLLIYILRKRIGRIGGRKILLSFVKLFMLSVVMGVITTFFIQIYFIASDDLSRRVFILLSSIIIAVVLYILLSLIFKSEELLFLLKLIKRGK